MNELKNYVDELFKFKPRTEEVNDLKEEILGNMIAKRDDLILQGYDEDIATKTAKESIDSVDSLIDGSSLIMIERCVADCLQAALLGSIVFWILSMPLMLVGYKMFSSLGMIVSLIFGVLYIASNRSKDDTLAFVSIEGVRKKCRIVWWMWGLFFAVYVVMVAALTFGSNVWFSRPLRIDGPYQLANILSRFYAPLLTIIVPITTGQFPKIFVNHERRD